MSKPKIFFIADDDTDDQEIFIEALHEIDKSIQCYTALNGEDAMHKLKKELKAIPDYIFLDLNMPRLNGKECLIEIKKVDELRHVPVFLYSTSAERRDVDEATRLGAAGFFKKPHKFSELCEVLSNVIARDWKNNNS